MPDRFARFCATIDTSGGHIQVCLCVILLGGLFALLKIPKAEDLIVAGASTLFLAMRGRGAENHDYGAPQTGAVIPELTGMSSRSTTTTTATVSAVPPPDLEDRSDR